jgi:hypothetical protein
MQGAIWIALSVPLGMLAGRWLRHRFAAWFVAGLPHEEDGE